MRARILCVIGALALALPGPSYAQSGGAAAATSTASQGDIPTAASAPGLGYADFGLRGDNLAGDRARYNRYRDLRDGAFLDRFRFAKETASWAFLGRAEHVGYKDQRFFGEYESFGRLKAGFVWDQIPLFISGDTRSLQSNTGNGVLVIDDAIQRSIENTPVAADKTLRLSNAMLTAPGFDLESWRHTALFDLTYSASRYTDLKFNLKNTQRKGANLQSFGILSSPGGSPAQELAVPMQTRTTDIEAMVEYANARGLVTAGMNASWFDNSIPTVQFDNPLRITDAAGGNSSKGLAPTWPSNDRVSFVASGTYKLAARTRALASISIGRANQNEDLVPPTINTAIVAPPLFRPSAEARADIVSMIYGINSRPVDNLWLNARYRYYDYANKTPHFEAQQLVGDAALGTALWETEPLSVRNQMLDLDASFTPIDHFAFGLGYARRDDRRTFRIFEDTAEDTFRMSVDSTGSAFYTIRVKYEFSTRNGSGFEPELLEEVGEQPDMRHFDVANRERNRVTTVLTLTPLPWLNVNGSIGAGRDDYKDTGFGLRDNRNRSYGIGLDMSPLTSVNVGASYQREKYTANQYSRSGDNTPAQFNNPDRDWSLDTDDRVNTTTAYVDLLKVFPKTDLRFSYDLSDGKVTYVYGVAAEAVLFPTTPLAQLPPVTNRINTVRTDMQYFLRQNIALGAAYWFEDYNVDDFSLNSDVINTLNIGTATIYSGYLYRPYTAHTVSLRVTYLW